MKQNYNLLTRSTALPNAANTFFTKSKLKLNSFLLMLVMLFGFSDAFGQIVQDITATGAGTWTVPAGTGGTITIEAWGAGGSGGGATGKDRGGSGGTGGTYVIKTYPAGSYTPGVTTYNLFVAGTTTGGAAGSNGNNGAATWFESNLIVNAPGGKAGLAGNGAAVTALSTGAIPAAGAVYATGTSAGTAGNGSAGSAGANGGGAGGNAVTAGNNAATNGNPGIVIGGGGSGGAVGGGGCGCSATGGSGARGQIRITYHLAPTISSFTPNSGCIGTSVTITGTNFTGASSVTFNGTTSSYTVNSATQITATVPAGATIGAIAVTTSGGTVNSAGTFTVNPTPAAIGGGAATVCVGATTPAFTNAVGGGTWSIINGTGSATISAVGIVTGVSVGTATVVYTIGTCTASTPINVITTPATVVGPTPANAATNVCYAGAGAVNSISWAASASATSYDVYFGAGSLPGTVTANVATNSYTTGVLAASTTYYWRIVARNSCGDAVTSATFTFTTAALSCDPIVYCTPIGVNPTFSISNVTFAGINNNSPVLVNVAGPDYEDFSAITGNVTAGNTYNISVTANGLSPNLFYVYVYFDWNNNGNFTDDGGAYVLGNYTTNAATLNMNILIPVTAYVGTIRMRVGNSFNAVYDPCITAGGNFQFEDYSLNIASAPPCTEPTAQPTALVLTAGTPSGTALNGSFTAASPAPQNYLIVMNTTGTAPTGLIMDGTTYPIGSSIGVGNTVVDTDSNTTFTATGLNPSTTYYFFIYSMNALCTGGPLYNTNPTVLIGNATTSTGAPTYCTPTTTLGQNDDKYISRVAFIGTLVETNNISTYSNTTPGYQDFTGLALKAQQAQGEGVNMIVESIGGRTRLHAWVDWNKNGTFEASEMVYGPPAAGISSTFGFVIPSGTVPGDYRIRVRTYNAYRGADENFGLNFDACQPFSTISIGGLTYTQYGEAEDYLFTVIQRCDANITSVVDGDVCNSGVVDLIANGTAGTTEIRWYTALTGGSYLGSSLNGDTFETPSIATTTTYYCTAWNGTCESFVRTPVVARVNPTPTLTFTQSSPDVCGEDTIVALTAGGDKQLTDLLYERFEGGGLGAFTNVNSDPSPAAVKADTQWMVRASTFVPTAGDSWKPAISSGLAPNSFALATSDSGTPPETLVENSLTSGTLNSTGYLNLTMTMKFYYSRYFPDNTNNADEYVRIQISTNNGTTWTTLQEFTADTGIGTKFTDLSYNLNGYINQANLRVRVLHNSLGSVTGWLPDGVAVDDVRIFGEVPLNTAFVWSSPSTLPDVYTDPAATPGNEYVAGTPVVTVYVKPTLAQLEMGSYVFTATATLSNGCTASQDITILNKSKIWKGTNGNDWADAANWEPVGVPDANSCVIIPSILDTNNNKSEIIGPGFNGFGKTLEVKDDGILEVNSVNTLTITDYVKVAPAGTFLIEDSSSLVQINNVANTGNIRMQRNTNIRKLDYVYWSSPVAGFSSGAISPLTPASFIYKWAPTTVTGYASNFGNWVAGSESMATGAGYIVRGPDNFTTTKQIHQANFIGVPNNGIITTPISRSTYTGANYTGPTSTQVTADDDNWNLIGNPYPSAVNADTFLATNSTKISGFVKIWTHGTLPLSTTSDPFYQDFVLNYTVADYITHNALGGTQPTFDGFIPAGQGFFVRMIDAAATPNTVEFNNTMRSRTFRNDQFFRDGNVIPTNEKHRIWLQLVSPAGTESKSLVGYATSATNSIDHLYDAINVGVKTNFEIYSVAENQGLSIQGRSLPFDANDQIQLGVTIPQNGNYTIAIAAVDGLFTTGTQNIYLEDKLLNITHDLRSAPYSFTGTVGSNETRFVLKFNNETLGNEDFTTNAVTVYTNESINVNATNQTIKSVRVHDLLGRVIGTFNNVNANTFSTRNVVKTQSPLLVEVTLENGATKTYKVIF
jgi:hypothetical protein